MTAIRVFICISVVFAVFAPASHADSVTFFVSPYGDCLYRFGQYWVMAVLELSAPAVALEVTNNFYCCTGPGISWNFPVSGDPNTLLTVDFGECISGSVVLFTAEFEGSCPKLLGGPKTVGPGEDSPPVLIGCDDQLRYLVPPCSATQPLLQTPADGETAVSLTPFMSWDYQFGDYCHEGIGLATFTIYYGTDPGNLDQTFSTNDSNEATLPMLEPETQYFWRVKVWDDFAYYIGSMTNFSDTRSFTTSGPVPAKTTTWGAVKSLYKD